MSKTVNRGRLRSVTTRPMYDKEKNLAGYSVSAHNEPAEMDSRDVDASGGAMPVGSYGGESETPHETLESAEAMAHSHHAENEKKFGGKKSKRMAMDDSQAQAAFGRNT